VLLLLLLPERLPSLIPLSRRPFASETTILAYIDIDLSGFAGREVEKQNFLQICIRSLPVKTSTPQDEAVVVNIELDPDAAR